MPNLLHLFSVALVTLYISAMPKPAVPASETETTSTDVSLSKKEEEDNEQIPWLTERRLTWEDFLCEPKRNTDAVASTSTTLGLAYQINSKGLTYDISCNFSKVKSWGLVQTPYILAHEQGHFDITEIYARKLHQAISEYNINPRFFKQDINTIYNKIVAEKEAFQQAYDGQTDHSRNKRVQSEWLKVIDLILEDTDAYAAYP